MWHVAVWYVMVWYGVVFIADKTSCRGLGALRATKLPTKTTRLHRREQMRCPPELMAGSIIGHVEMSTFYFKTAAKPV